MIGANRNRNGHGEITCPYRCCRADLTSTERKAAKRRLRTREKRAWKNDASP